MHEVLIHVEKTFDGQFLALVRDETGILATSPPCRSFETAEATVAYLKGVIVRTIGGLQLRSDIPD